MADPPKKSWSPASWSREDYAKARRVQANPAAYSPEIVQRVSERIPLWERANPELAAGKPPKPKTGGGPETVSETPAPEYSVPETVARSAMKGATLNYGEEGSARAAELLSRVDPLGWLGVDPAPRRYAAGSRQADMEQQLDRENKEAEAANPRAAMVGWGLGALPLGAVLSGTAPAAEAGLGMRALAGAVEGGVLGSAAGAGDNPEDRGQGAREGLAYGAGGGAAAPVLLAPVRALHKDMGSRASRNRAASTGMTPSQASRLAADTGDPGNVEAIEEFGRNIERAGLHKGGPGPATPERYRRNAKKAMDTSGPQTNAIAQEATAKGVAANLDRVADELVDEATRLSKLGVPEAERDAEELFERALQLSQKTDKGFEAALELRRYFDDKAHNATGAMQTEQAERYAMLAGKIRKAMLDDLEKADPELKARFEEANKMYETAVNTRRFAGGKVIRDATGGPAQSVRQAVVGPALPAYRSSLASIQRQGERSYSPLLYQGVSPVVGYQGAEIAPPGFDRTLDYIEQLRQRLPR